MAGVANAVIRWAIVVIMGIITFLPNYGIAALSIQFFLGAPILVTMVDLVWIIALALVLPFSLRLFRWISTAAVTAITSASVFLLWRDVSAVFNAWPWYMWLVVVASVSVGWLLVSTPMWRWAKGTLPIAQTDHHDAVPTHHS